MNNIVESLESDTSKNNQRKLKFFIGSCLGVVMLCACSAVTAIWGLDLFENRSKAESLEVESSGNEITETSCVPRNEDGSPSDLDIHSLTEKIREDPDNAVRYRDRAIAYFDLGEYEKAIEDLNEAIRLKPDYSAAYNSRGLSYQYLGRYESAIADYTKAIELRRCWFYFGNLGWAHLELGNYSAAIHDYSEVIRLNPSYSLAYYNRGWAYAELGNYSAAVNDYTEVIRLDPTDVDAFNNRGWAYENLGEYNRALADYRKALDLDPSDSYARDGIEYIESFLNGSDNVVVPLPDNDFGDNLPAACPHGYAPTGSGGNCELDWTLIDP